MTLRIALLVLLAPLLLAADLQPEARGEVAPDRDVDIEHLRLELTVDLDGRRVEGAAVHTVKLLRDGQRRVVFHQVGLAFERVAWDGAELPFRLAGEQVVVTLPEGLERGAAGELRFEYSAQPTSGLHFRAPGPASPDDHLEVFSQGQGTDNRHWFPTFDHPGDRFTWEGLFTVPDGFTAVSGGVLVGTEPAAEGWTRWHYRLDEGLVSYLVTLAVARYERFELEGGSVPLEVFAPPGTDEATVLRTVGRTGEMVQTFEELLGIEYPWPVYRQTFVQRFLYSGMENTSATTMHRRLLYPARVEDHRGRAEAIVAHELAHQWFGDLVVCRSWREIWLSEGFATWLTHRWGQHRWGPERAAVRAWDNHRGVTGADDRGDRVLVKRFWATDLGRADPYGKGSAVLRMLRVMLGERVFAEGLAEYTRRHGFGLARTVDFQRAMEDASGQSLDWFFDQWIYLPGHPKLQVKHRLEEDGTRVRVSIRQTQDTSGLVPLFTLPVELEIATSTGSRIERVWMEEASLSVTLPVDGELYWVAIDPRGGLLATVEHETAPAERLARLESLHPYAAVGAFRELRGLDGVPTERERGAVAGLLLGEATPLAWRIEAARVLGAWKDEASTASLLEALKAERGRPEGSSRLVEVLVGQLGEGLARPGVVEALDRVLAREKVEYVRAAALKALGELLEEDARGRALTALRGDSDQMIVQRAAADVLGRHGRASDLGALAPLREGRVHRELRHAALWASTRIAAREPVGRERDDARRPVARDAERLLEDLDIRGRQTAIAILGQVGDARSVAALQAFARVEQDQALLDAAERSIDAIRTRTDREPDPVAGELDARLERIEQRLDEAEADLKRLDERR